VAVVAVFTHHQGQPEPEVLVAGALVATTQEALLLVELPTQEAVVEELTKVQGQARVVLVL
jgi:hypothetical protein